MVCQNINLQASTFDAPGQKLKRLASLIRQEQSGLAGLTCGTSIAGNTRIWNDLLIFTKRQLGTMKFDVKNLVSVDHKTLRRINRANILNLIRENSVISRIEISKMTGLKKSTVTSIVGELIKDNLVYEDSLGQSSVGRKPVTLKLNEKSRLVGCVDVKHGRATIAVCDLNRNVLAQKTVETGKGERFFIGCAKTLAGLSRRFSEPMAGVGVVVPSLVNHEQGRIYWDYSHDWENIDVRKLFKERVDCPVYVENDGRASALGELWFDDAVRDLKCFVSLWICEGIGVGIVINNELYHGAYSLDGQFGQQLIRIDSKWEEITQENTWEDNASNLGVVKRYHGYTESAWQGRVRDIEPAAGQLIDLALARDALAERALKETARYLGVGIANIVNGLSPEQIVIGGQIVRVWDLIIPEILKQMELQLLVHLKPVDEMIIPSSLDDPTFAGAHAMVLSEHFKTYRRVY